MEIQSPRLPPTLQHVWEGSDQDKAALAIHPAAPAATAKGPLVMLPQLLNASLEGESANHEVRATLGVGCSQSASPNPFCFSESTPQLRLGTSTFITTI